MDNDLSDLQKEALRIAEREGGTLFYYVNVLDDNYKEHRFMVNRYFNGVDVIEVPLTKE